mgnify:CR=1 FL=1
MRVPVCVCILQQAAGAAAGGGALHVGAVSGRGPGADGGGGGGEGHVAGRPARAARRWVRGRAERRVCVGEEGNAFEVQCDGGRVRPCRCLGSRNPAQPPSHTFPPFLGLISQTPKAV